MRWRLLLDRMRPRGAWGGTAPIRAELFGAERLEQHAATLAAAQAVAARVPAAAPLHSRLNHNAAALLGSYRASAHEVAGARELVPAAEWLLDNYHLVDAHVREIRDDLSPGFYRQLPKLAGGPFAGYPRVLGVAWAYVAHTDSHLDVEMLRRFIAAYQRVQPLTIGELWAVAITLRIVLIENLRRLADQIDAGRESRREADGLAARLLASGAARSALAADIVARSPEPLDEVFAAQLAKRLRDQDPRHMPALRWLEERLAAQGASVDTVVDRTQQRLGASNVSVRNVITSLRLVSDIDWSDFFESVSLVDARLRDGSAFAGMDFPTRNLYRDAIEQLSRGSIATELEVAGLALARTKDAQTMQGTADGARRDPGYHLVGPGRRDFELALHFRPAIPLRLKRLGVRLGIGGYVGSLMATTLALLALALLALDAAGVADGWIALFALLAFIPASEVAATLVNMLVGATCGASRLPGLELAGGVPTSLRTLVAVPTLLTSEADLQEQIERLEVHHLAGDSGDLVFALLSDGIDADSEVLPADARLLDAAAQAIAQLNLRHGPGPAGDRFLILHRRRRFNASEGKWMGWERKRGKLRELNRLLRGAVDTSFVPVAGRPVQVPAQVRYVITLDADTRLPRDAARQLVGKMAHPLNQPVFSTAWQRVVAGHAILQPRVTPSLPMGREGSLYQRVFSAPGGTDPYATTVSDVYQDLFEEGSFTGKGIYDIDAFEASLDERVPENALLSHDLYEGVFARAGLAADIEVVEEFPARYDVVAKRLHRWMRGDWQLLPMLASSTDRRAMPVLGRWKVIDNLRRSLVAIATLPALGVAWLLPVPAALVGSALVVATIAVPALLPALSAAWPRRLDIRPRNYLAQRATDLRLASTRVLLSFIFLPDHAWRAGDAIVRTLWRLRVSHRRLLEWTTAAKSSASPRPEVAGYMRQMAGGSALGVAMSAGALAFAPSSWPLVLPCALLWLASPVVAQWVSRAPTTRTRRALSPADARQLRLVARRTWRYFETFVTPEDNMLPPDNFQETPRPVVAHRTSPTNIGLYLLAAVAARDFGWTGTLRTVERLEACFASMQKLRRFRGHFLNWYGTQDLAALLPAYVSTVDSGNLAAHLITMANACEEWAGALLLGDSRPGVEDTLALCRQAITTMPGGDSREKRALVAVLDEFDARLGRQAASFQEPVLQRLAAKAARLALQFTPKAAASDMEITGWIDALGALLVEHARDRDVALTAPELLRQRLLALAGSARALAMEMDFSFLFDPQRKLLSIGYSLATNSLDAGCYDLLASEARLASLFAIAKGDVPTRHWFRLGRLATPLGSGAALLSWSGSMFEYLMPSLVMRAPVGSMLEQTSRLVVARQQAHGRALGIPWGISESAYNARDFEFTYQYTNFGVAGLGLKRGLSGDTVVAPYATALACMVDPRGALDNFNLLAAMGALGQYGFHEALDFTRSRLPSGQAVAIVRSFMTHHQGMTIVAIANTLQNGRMRWRFHREPMIKASELLLQERMPRDVYTGHPRAEEVATAARDAHDEVATMRQLTPGATGAPATHLLSNGQYAVMLTDTGGGYSRWNDLAITRWREDSTREDWGTFIFLRDVQGGSTWSAAARPLHGAPGERQVVFSEDHASFVHRGAGLTTTMEVIVSGEHNGEVRRVSIANNGWRSRDIELTSYAELALASPATDSAHPAFAKMFVQTEYLPEFAALVATRRLRSPEERQVWAAHFAVVEDGSAMDQEYETDRARFIGRGRDITAPAALSGAKPLSNTTGTVLDPVFCLRQRLSIAAGKGVHVDFWTVVAASREELLGLIDTHHDRSAFDRARTLAWTQAQVQLRHIDVDAAEAADFQRLAAPLLHADRRFRPPSAVIKHGAGPQSALWQHSISGDLPIVLLAIDDIGDIAQVRQLLRAHEYWRMKRLGVDLVILNERASSYVQDLQVAIEAAVRTHASRPRSGDQPEQGFVHVLRADLMSMESRALLRAVARVVLSARRGSIGDHLEVVLPAESPQATGRIALRSGWPEATAPSVPPALEFFNGFGGFDKDGSEYVTVLDRRQCTPAPWINVIANEGFGFHVSAEGSGYTWAANSRDNRITQWSNDPVSDPPGEALYVRDEATGELWTPTAQPIRDDGTYIARHGFGYSRFEHEAHGIALELLTFVPLSDPVRISRLRLTNRSTRPRRLSVTSYTEWVLGTWRGASAPFISTEMDADTGAMLARNPWNTAFASRVAFADLCALQTSWTADRTEFLGHNGSLSAPSCLVERNALSGSTGAGMDPCAALQAMVQVDAGETVEVVLLLGQGSSLDETRALVRKYRAADVDALLATVTSHWRTVLGAVQVRTPDRALDIMLNGWLLYQTLACRIRARAAFYQASGAWGFRDQLQDGMALTLAQPAQTRGHILRAAARQFIEGDVQHWWLPQSGKGTRTHISDDHLWLAFATATYVECSGDEGILDEVVPYLEGEPLPPEQAEHFSQAMASGLAAPLFDHCVSAIEHALVRIGPHGLPLMGTGDWNDGMNRVGAQGRGESVWVAWMLLRTLALFAPLAQRRDPGLATRWRARADDLHGAVERAAWDGQWYRRATFDDGTWLGTNGADACCIDSIAQSWAVLSNAADPARARTAMASLEQHLVRHDDGLALLFTPPFDKDPRDPGYVKGYPPGLRENGGQYTHAALWAVMALAQLRESGKAHALLAMLNPINHSRTAVEARRYKVEPYVVAADVYSVAPHVGRGGWTWYTGSAAWMYRAGMESVLGINRRGDHLVVEPRMPPAWSGFDAVVTVASTTCTVQVRAVGNDGAVRPHAMLDGAHIAGPEQPARVPLDGHDHLVQVFV